MCDIEPHYPQETSYPDPPTAAHHHFSAAAAQPQCQEPAPARPSPHSTSSPSATDYQLLGFTKLPLPHSIPIASPPPHPLRRTLSEPIYSPRTANYSPPPAEFSNSPIFLGSKRSIAQESVQFPNGTTSSPLQRTGSDQNPIVHVAGPSRTPTRPPAGRKSSRSSPTCGESPTTKRMKRMKERLKEMSQWWNEIVSEDDEDETEPEPENDCSNNNPKEDGEKHKENPAQEDVWIEKNGECLVLHFRCPCSKGYEVLLTGRNCYYKLTGF